MIKRNPVFLFKALALFCFPTVSLTSAGQVAFRIKVTNSTNAPFAFRLKEEKANIVDPGKSTIVSDSVSYGTFSSVGVKLNPVDRQFDPDRIIPVIVEDGSSLDLTIHDLAKIRSGSGFSISGLPFEKEQQQYFKVFLPKKKEYEIREINEYKKRKEPGVTNVQHDSIANMTLMHRRVYLQFADSFITSIKHSALAYHLFRTELLNPRYLLTNGKQRTLKMFRRLDPAWLDTQVGKLVASEIKKIEANAVGSVVQNFKFRTKDLKEHHFYDLIKPSQQALLIFTSRGCRACKEQIPVIREIKKKKPDLQVLYVSLDLKKRDWEDDLKSNYPGLITLNQEPYNFSIDLEDLFRVTFIPQVFLIDQDHRIVYDNLSPYEDDSLDSLKVLFGIKNK